MKKRMLSLALTLVMLISLLSVSSLAASLPFTDVPSGQWYYNDVKNAYEMNLINGKSATKFCPNDNLTYAEAVKLAACMNQRYQTGSVKLENGDPWYQSYVDYCKTNSMISKDYSWNSGATRAGYMEIFANALPASALKQINEVPDGSIPDVSMSHPQAAAIYKLYRAGILQGNDAAHNCNPSSNIKRSEVAAILARMMDASKRITFSMDQNALRFTKQPAEKHSGKPGEWAKLTVEVAGGKQPYTYHWLHTDAAGGYEFTSTYARGTDKATCEVLFDKNNPALNQPILCKVKDAAGTEIRTENITLTLAQGDPLVITQEPMGAEVPEGTSATATVAVSGGVEPYSYSWEYEHMPSQWRSCSDSRDASGVTTASLTLVANPSNGMTNKALRCVISDAAGQQIITRNVIINGIHAAPMMAKVHFSVIDSDPVQNPDIRLAVEVTGGLAPYGYQWQYADDYGNWHDITKTEADGANTLVLEIPYDSPIAYNDSTHGTYVRCCIGDVAGNGVISDPILAAFHASIEELSYPTHYVLKATAMGGVGPYTYEWGIYMGPSLGWRYSFDDEGIYGWGIDQLTFDYSDMNRLGTADKYYGNNCMCIVTDALGNKIFVSQYAYPG